VQRDVAVGRGDEAVLLGRRHVAVHEVHVGVPGGRLLELLVLDRVVLGVDALEHELRPRVVLREGPQERFERSERVLAREDRVEVVHEQEQEAFGKAQLLPADRPDDRPADRRRHVHDRNG
jgi:hypothetical protein